MTTALITMDAAKKNGAMVYLNEGYLAPNVDLYKIELTEIRLNVPSKNEKGYYNQYDQDSDVHVVDGKFVPKREAVDRMSEAAGISYVPEHSRTWAEVIEDPICGKRTVYISEQQGRERSSDGSWRYSSVQPYEFDPVLRAMADVGITELNEKTRNLARDGKGKTVAQRIVDYMKFGRQRAETGARLRVTHELTGMPAAYTEKQLMKGLVFGRIVQNTGYILGTPEGRAMATAQALGVDVSSLFGGRKIACEPAEAARPANETSPPDDDPIPAAFTVETDEAFPDFDDDPAPEAAKEAADAFKAVSDELLGLIQDNAELLGTASKSGKIPFVAAKTELEDTNGTLESRRAMLKKIQDFIRAVDEAKKARGAA